MTNETHSFNSTEEALQFLADRLSSAQVELAETKGVVTAISAAANGQGVSLRRVLEVLIEQQDNRFAQHILDGLNGTKPPEDQKPSGVHLKVVRDEE